MDQTVILVSTQVVYVDNNILVNYVYANPETSYGSQECLLLQNDLWGYDRKWNCGNIHVQAKLAFDVQPIGYTDNIIEKQK